VKETIKNIVYGALDAATGERGVARRIGGETVRFPARYSRYYEADYEPELFKFLRRRLRAGDVFFDCGAHIGLFTVVASRLVGGDGGGGGGRVFSFEPTPATREVLEKVVAINDCRNVEVRPEAVSRAAGTAVFFDTGGECSNANSLVKLNRHKDGGLTVPTVSIDEFARKRGNLEINCIKIDVEGAEFDVLVGAENTVRNNRPAVYLGLHPPAIRQSDASLSDVWERLRDYRLRIKYRGEFVEKDWFIRQDDLFDVECLPEETINDDER
jgi:FkbM family methyltransferase